MTTNQNLSSDTSLFENLSPGDHLCCIYESEAEYRKVITPYIQKGLERGEKVICIVDAHTADAVLGYLRDQEVDAAVYLASGQLAMATHEDMYLRDETFDPDGMIAFLGAAMESALAQGYKALRVTGEMTWALHGLPDSERLIEYEAKLDLFLPGSQCSAVCQYDRRRFDPAILQDVIAVHPIVIIGTQRYENYHFAPPDVFLSNRPEARLQQIIQSLQERKQAEQTSRENERRLSVISSNLTSAALFVYVHDTKGRFYYEHISLSLEQMIGVNTEDVLQDAAKIRKLILPEYRAQLRQAERESQANLTRLEMEIRLRHAHTRKIRWVLMRSTPYRRLDGSTFWYGVLIDITEHKRAEEEIHKLNAELELRVEERTRELRAAQEQLVRHEKLVVLGQMAGSIAHELRNPLNVIFSSIYYLKTVQPEAADNVKKYLGIIEQETHIAEKTISDLLDFARIKSVDRETVSVPDLVRQTLERFPVPAHVKVTLNLPADLLPVFADPRQISQVLGNLTTNACQAMPTVGKLIISAKAQGDMVAIAVKDTGTGIAPENMKKLFEPLFTTKAKGIGLGLAVSQKLVEANGGRIEVQSELDKGTMFTVFLPVDKTAK